MGGESKSLSTDAASKIIAQDLLLVHFGHRHPSLGCRREDHARKKPKKDAKSTRVFNLNERMMESESWVCDERISTRPGGQTALLLCRKNETGSEICLFEEDIEVPLDRCYPSNSKPFASAIPGRKWGCPIPIFLDDRLHISVISKILSAISVWEENTSWKFTVRDKEHDYVNFTPSEGCHAVVGRFYGSHNVGLSSKCSLRSVIHEIGHVIGLWHEHSRPDRDEYIRVIWSNIDTRYKSNFYRDWNSYNVTPYDFYSIMHYRLNSFLCKRGKCSLHALEKPFDKTIEIIRGHPPCCKERYTPDQCCVGNMETLSKSDIIQANERLEGICGEVKQAAADFVKGKESFQAGVRTWGFLILILAFL